MTGVLVNTGAVLLGSVCGLLFRKGIPAKYRDAIMLALGICTLFLGIQGSLKSENALVAIVSMVLGTAIGTALDLDAKLNRFGAWVEKKTTRNVGAGGSVAQGMVTAFLLWCVGAMTIVGCLQAGVAGDNQMLYTKSMLDLISSVMLASSLGVGVLYACGLLFAVQGSLVLLAGLIQPLLTDSMVNEITCVGSLAILALGLNLVGITKMKVANFLPAVLLAPFVCVLLAMLPM